MCFHSNQLSWGINHPLISLWSFIRLSTMLAPLISSLDKIYCTWQQKDMSWLSCRRRVILPFAQPCCLVYLLSCHLLSAHLQPCNLLICCLVVLPPAASLSCRLATMSCSHWASLVSLLRCLLCTIFVMGRKMNVKPSSIQFQNLTGG